MSSGGKGQEGWSQLEGTSEVDSSDITYWGHALQEQKDPQHCRIGFANIHGLGLFAKHNKNREFYSFTQLYDFDIFGMAETNVNWQVVPIQDRLFERSRSWWQLRHVLYSYLSQDSALH